MDAIDLVDAGPSTCLGRWHDGSVRLGAPTLLDLGASNGASDRDPAIDPENLFLVWSSNRAGSGGSTGYDIWDATRASPTDAFGSPTMNPNLSSPEDDTKVAFTLDRLDAIIARGAGAPVQAHLVEGTRTVPSGSFGGFSMTNLATIDGSIDQYDPALSDDGLRLYYADGNPQVLTVASRATRNDAFAIVQTIPGVSGSSDADADLGDGERLLLFSSTRPGGPGLVSMYYATRATPGDAFGAPQLVPDINGTAHDGDPSLSRDGCTLYFASDRATAGTFRIYVSSVIVD